MPRRFWDSRRPLKPGSAVAAVMVTHDGRYVLQHRDPLPHIFFPDLWGCFGGAVEAGETSEVALAREVTEETGLVFPPGDFRLFTTMTFDFGFAPGGGVIDRLFYEIEIDPCRLDNVVLGEGQAWGVFTAREMFCDIDLTPYDHFALWQHHNRSRFVF